MQNFKFIKFMRDSDWLNCIKVVALNRFCSTIYATNLKTIISHSSLKISGLLLLSYYTKSDICPSYKTWDYKVLSYTPFHFSFIVPLIRRKRLEKRQQRDDLLKVLLCSVFLFFLVYISFVPIMLPIMEEISKTTIRNSNCLFLNIYDSLQL